MTKTRCIHLAIPFLVLSAPLAEADEVSENLLRRIVVEHTANRERLTSWVGAVDIGINVTGERPLNQTARVTFAYDRNRNSWQYRWKYLTTADGILGNAESGGMFVDGKWYSYAPYQPDTNMRQAVSIQPTPPPEIGPMSAIFDPMFYFKVREDDLKEKIEGWLKVKDADWMRLDVSRDGDVVTVDQGNIHIPFATAVYKFDLACAGNLISLIARDDVREVKREFEWEERDGVWVPREATYVNATLDGTHIQAKTVTWTANTVNEPIAPETFTLEGLKVVPGAMISDHRTMKSSHYKEDPSEAKAELLPPKPANSRQWILMGFNVLLIISLLAYLSYRNWPSSKPKE